MHIIECLLMFWRINTKNESVIRINSIFIVWCLSIVLLLIFKFHTCTNPQIDSFPDFITICVFFVSFFIEIFYCYLNSISYLFHQDFNLISPLLTEETPNLPMLNLKIQYQRSELFKQHFNNKTLRHLMWYLYGKVFPYTGEYICRTSSFCCWMFKLIMQRWTLWIY